jgi:hypothetical protein
VPCYLQWHIYQNNTWYLSKNPKGQESMDWYDLSPETKHCKTRLPYSAKLPIKIKREIQTFHDKQKLKQLKTTKPTLWKTLKGVLYIEEEERCTQAWGSRRYNNHKYMYVNSISSNKHDWT